jgi:hypothetical protein
LSPVPALHPARMAGFFRILVDFASRDDDSQTFSPLTANDTYQLS